MIPKWLEWAKSLQAIAQNGLEYAGNEFDIERYNSVMDIAAEILSEHSLVKKEVIKELFSEQAGYATPRVDVRGVVFKDDKVLMVKEKSDGAGLFQAAGPIRTKPPQLRLKGRSLRSLVLLFAPQGFLHYLTVTSRGTFHHTPFTSTRYFSSVNFREAKRL
jgi:hypothetical protein